MSSEKILVVDDEDHIVELISYNLINSGYNVLTANNGLDAVRLAKEENPDLILLDLMIPGLDGFDVCKAIRNDNETKEISIIMLTAKGEELDKILGLELGADDYITKPFSAKEVAFRLKVRLKVFDKNINKEIKSKNNIIKFGDISINEETGEVYKGSQSLEFTAKELKLLIYLVNNPNRIISKEMICKEVWGDDFFGYDNTITVHIRKLRKKIEDTPSKPKYITTVIGLGYKFTKGD